MGSNENIQHMEARAFSIPTESPESDGTLEWSATTMVLVTVRAQGVTGLGYSYAHEACAPLIRKTLFPVIEGKSPFFIGALWEEMNAKARNYGRLGMASTAIAAVDIALWDLKARLLDLPLVKLLGASRKEVPVYGSGGFTSYSEPKLCQQLEGWANEGISMVKMKIGLEADKDAARVAAARQAIGKKTQLFVDANGAYAKKQALELAGIFSEQNVRWFEEPVSSQDLAGLRDIRERAAMDVAAGEYNYDVRMARAMLAAEAVDVLQADATRCGITGFLRMESLCDGFECPFSCHTAPALHGHLGCVGNRVRHIEYFFDHFRIEQMFFEGATVRHEGGFIRPDLTQPGLGLAFKSQDAEKFRVNV